MRARLPDADGFVERDGVRIAWEAFGSGEPTLLLLPTWSIVHSRIWKMQVPYLARHYRVVTFDGRGNGRSDRPDEARAYADTEFVADAVAVLDATDTARAIVLGLSIGGAWALRMAAEHADRVEALVVEAPSVPLGDPLASRDGPPVDQPLDVYEGWTKYNHHYWRQDYSDFLQFFFGRCFSEPHSTKPIEDAVGWGLETDAETLIHTQVAPYFADGSHPETVAAELAARVQCPSLVIHSAADEVTAVSRGRELARAMGGEFVELAGAGHIPSVREPVLFNRLVREFVDRVHPPRPGAATRGGTPVRGYSLGRRPRALYISSPIGLGHARRDVAIAKELKRLVPDLEIDWLAQHPVTAVLAAEGEALHPASADLASESAHIENESGEHDLHAFQAIRRMDEILLSNFMVFHDLVEQVPYDLVIGDEAWEVDYHLHENPELKRFSYAWMTDFVGWVPMPEGGEREAAITADYNAEMIEHRARYRRLRDHSIFVGDPDDIVPERFGPGLPQIREWTCENFQFAGYITGLEPVDGNARADLRAQLGYRDDERVCVVTVGGSAVGAPLLRRVLDAVPIVRGRMPDLRFLVVTGPRIDPESLPSNEGVTLRGYVPDLHRHLAACDIAVVQGGLTTCMELTANGRPFLYFPLANHFEQQIHVAHRLDRYGAGCRMDYRTSDPDAIAAAITATIDRPVTYRPVASDGAARAARMLADLF
ncbi:MAG: alpha/beta fold hydrolase [Chloroflexi bacterium]|nr:alpha/beta fold hydrolase [Chloroflexota bacterium]